jgi:hypothetical protein
VLADAHDRDRIAMQVKDEHAFVNASVTLTIADGARPHRGGAFIRRAR